MLESVCVRVCVRVCVYSRGRGNQALIQRARHQTERRTLEKRNLFWSPKRLNASLLDPLSDF